MMKRLPLMALVLGLAVLVLGSCQAQNENAPAPAVQAAPAAPADNAAPPAAAQAKGKHAWMDQLTAEQRQQLQAKVKELHKAGAKPEEIKAAVAEMLKGWGLAAPQGKGNAADKGQGKGHGGHAFMAKLTAEQKEQLLAKIKEMKAANAKPEEIKAAIAEMCKGWGIEMGGKGEGKDAGAGKGAGPAWMEKLTDEQKQQLQAKMKELRDAGKTREEIKAAVAEMLKGWGIERGAAPGAGKAQAGGKLKAIMDKLTAEQKQQLREKVKELKDARKTRQEIMAAVKEMLKGWGIEAGAAGPQ